VANLDPFLDLHEAPNLHVISDLAPVEVDEPENADAFTQNDVRRDLLVWGLWQVHKSTWFT
jgi:hypothetical protein